MTEVRLAVVSLDDLRKLVSEVVAKAVAEGVRSGDDWVDARSSLLGRRLFLRLAREGAFPVSKRGKAYVARRKDVDAYLNTQRIIPKVEQAKSTRALASTVGEDPIARALDCGRLRIIKNKP